MKGSALRWPSAIGQTGLVRAFHRGRASALETARVSAEITRDVGERRTFVGDPWRYFHVVLGIELTTQQSDALETIEHETRVLIPSGHDLGKTLLLAGWGLYVFDAVAAIRDPESGLDEQGGRLLLPGPSEDTVRETIYSEMLSLARRAESRGFRMPGVRSDKSVTWRVREKWNMESLTPPRRVGQKVAHTASGRHHQNQHALIEEGQGVDESLWLAAEGMCSSSGNKIISAFNPTEPSGPAYKRAQEGTYKVVHLDAFDHPNVRDRRIQITAAIDFKVIDAGVRGQCRDRGPYPATPIDPEHGDFAYALPPIEDGDSAPERGARDDGILGHPDGQVRVYRPNAAFIAQKRGRWPTSSESGLFDAEAWQRGVARWRREPDPRSAPDRVGVDPSREGNDECTAAPAWGESAQSLLRAFAEAQANGKAAIEELQRTRRARTGEIRVLAKGKGPDVARQLHAMFPVSPFVMDLGSVGSSPYDHLVDVLHRDATGVWFSAAALPRTSDAEPFCDNLRTQLYVWGAMLLARDLVDPPDDILLREELFAHWLEPSTRTEEVFDKAKGYRVKKKVESVALVSKDRIKEQIGRSPDRADAWLLSLFAEAVKKARDLDPRNWKKVYA